MSTTQAKAQARTRIRAHRSARSSTDRRAAAEAIARHALAVLPAQPASVACYLSLPTEPGTDALLGALHRRDIDVVVPRTRGTVLEWVAFDPDAPVEVGRFGIREPEGPAVADALVACSVVFLPGLGADRTGHRLGQGGGFYDRALASVPDASAGGPLRAIVLFDDEVAEALPIEPHDCRVDVAVTPSGVHWFPGTVGTP